MSNTEIDFPKFINVAGSMSPAQQVDGFISIYQIHQHLLNNGMNVSIGYVERYVTREGGRELFESLDKDSPHHKLSPLGVDGWYHSGSGNSYVSYDVAVGIVNQILPEQDDFEQGGTDEEQVTDRKESIKAALILYDGPTTKNGVPTTSGLSSVLGFIVSAYERDEALSELEEEDV